MKKSYKASTSVVKKADLKVIPPSELFKGLPGPVNEAEHQVAQALEPLEKLGWMILANFSFTDLNGSKSKRGEADFVLLGPLGILVLEVKGGLLKWTESSHSQLIQTDLYHADGKLVDPWYQARKSAAFVQRAALDYFLSLGQERRIHWGYAAVFPEAELKVRAGRGSGTDELFLDRRSLPDLARKIPEILESFALSHGSIDGPGFHPQEWLNFVNQGLGSSIDFRIYGREYKHEAMIHRREEQDQLTQFLPTLLAGAPLPRVLLQGSAGTGKTVLLIEKAWACAQKYENVLVVCFNLPLRSHLMHALRKRNASCLVLAIHELAEFMLRNVPDFPSKPDPQDVLGMNHWYNHTLVQGALDSLGSDFQGFFDAILVDEAQDFHIKEWWDFLMKLHKNSDQGDWVIAWDPDQSIYSERGTPLIEDAFQRANRIRSYMPMHLPIWSLDVNFRNSAGIHRAMDQMIATPSRSAFRADLQESVIPVPLLKNTSNQLHHSLKQVLGQALEQYGLTAKNLVILGPHRLEHTELARVPKIGGVEIKAHRNEYSTENELFYSTIHRFKGLESDGVILYGFDPKDPSHKRLKWLAMSRARLVVWALGSQF